MPAGYHLTTFGMARLESYDGQVMPLSQQQLAFLVVLAVTRSITRTELAAILWPDRTKVQANHSLSQTIYAVQQKCGDIIGRSTGRVSLNRLLVRSDFDEIHRRSNNDITAENHVPEDFCSSLSSYPADTFDEWRQSVMSRLRARCSTPGVSLHVTETASDSDVAEDYSANKFIGRTSELAMVRRTWANCVRGVPSVVVVAGESGIGKSAFCRRVQRAIAIDGGSTHIAHCSPTAEFTPFGVPAALVNCSLPNQVSDSLETRARRYADQALQEWVQPSAIIIEDIHNVDDGSALWLEVVLRYADDSPIMAILSVNTDDRRDRDAVVSMVGRMGVGAVWIELPPLNDSESFDLIRSEEQKHGGTLPMSVLESIGLSAKGHPLFLIELTREALLREGRHLSTTRTDDDLYTETVDSILRRRIARLDRHSRTAAVCLAIVGKCSLEELILLTGLDSEACRQALSTLSDYRMVRGSVHDLDLNHELLRIAASKILSPVDRSRLHRETAAILLARERIDHGRVARHYYAAGELEKAFENAMAAASAADQAGSDRVALKHLGMAEMAAFTDADRTAVIVERARILSLSGAFDEASSILEPLETMLEDAEHQFGHDLLDLARTIDRLEKGLISTFSAVGRFKNLLARIRRHRDDRLTARVTRYLITAAHDSGHDLVVRWIIDEVSSGKLVGSNTGRVHLFILAANAQAVYGRVEEAHRLLDDARSGGAMGDRELEVSYYAVRGIAYLVQGQLSDAHEELGKALRKSFSGRGLWGRERVLTNLAVVEMEVGDLDAAQASLQRALQTATNHERLAVLANQAAWCIHSRRFDMLIDIIDDLEASNRMLGVRWAGTVAETFRAHWYLHHSYFQRALLVADALAAELPATRRDITDRSYSEIAIARSWLRAGRGPDAVERLRAMLESVPDAQWSCRLRLKAELASLLRKSSPVEARRLAQEVKSVARRNGAYAHLVPVPH